MPNQSPKSEDPKKKKKGKHKTNEYLKYSGMAFEMFAIMCLCTVGGSKLDEYMQNEKQYFTMLGAILGTVFALTYTLRDFISKKDK